ncbi:MAG: hypothetical protein HOP11_07480, partial [Saprospiraceae bacterium]|nr:hypothetical protein [Saprospiraceae bacterium]
MKTLLTPFEVIKYSQAGNSFPLDNVRRLIPVIEIDFMDYCFGLDYYNLLLRNVKTYEKAVIWKAGTYNSGDVVIYNGSLLESCNSANSTEPSVLNDKWKEVEKFTKKEYNKLWETHIRDVLSNKIYKESVPFATIQSGAKGLTVNAQDQSGNMTAPAKDIDFLCRTIQNQIDMMMNNMKRFIITQNDEYKKDNTK